MIHCLKVMTVSYERAEFGAFQLLTGHAKCSPSIFFLITSVLWLERVNLLTQK